MFGMLPFERSDDNLFDTFDKFVLEAELPGFDKGDIKLDVKDGILTITAEHSENQEQKDAKGAYIRRERRYGSFSRSFDITGIDEGSITAAYGKIEQCFVGDGMLAWLHIITGKVKEAEELLTRFKGKAQQENAERILPNIDTFLVRCALYDADKAAIAKWLAQAPDEELIFSIYDRFHYITKVRVYLQNGRNEQAYHLLLKCAYYAKVMQRTYIDIEVKLLLAITQYRMGEKKWDETLGEALTKAEEYHFVRIITRYVT